MALTSTNSLAELNRAAPGSLADNLRSISGPGVALGDFLNLIVAQGNQGSSSVAASATVTLGGVVHTGDVVTTTVAGTAIPYTLLAGDSTLTIAGASVSAALNANATFALSYLATNAAGVVTVTRRRKGTNGNGTTLTAAVTGAGATTTATASGNLAGGTGVDDLLAIV